MENKQQSVAILLSTYNGERYLNEQLKSIAQQSYQDYTLFVRDDGSTDKTLKIIDSWKKRMPIVMLESDSNLGPARSFMKMIKKCGNYQYYAFCDQDDIWDADKIEIAVEKLSNMTGPALYFCKGRSVNGKGDLLSVDNDINVSDLTIESELVCGFCPGCAMVFNHELVEKVRKQKYRCIPMHDMIFIMNSIALGKVIYDIEPHYSRRMHENNVVGKEGKKGLRRIKQSLNRWFVNSKKTPMDVYVSDFINNTVNESPNYNLNFLNALSNYRHSIKNKMYIHTNVKNLCADKRALNSFRLRLLLNLL